MRIIEGYENVTHDAVLPFEAGEYDRRAARVREAMDRDGVDVLVLTGAPNITYLTGYDTAMPTGYTALVLPKDGPAIFHCGELEVTCMLYNGTVEEIVAYRWFEPGDEASGLARILAERNLLEGVVGVEMSSADTFAVGALDARTFLTLRESIGDTPLVDATGLMLDVRVIKSEAEIECMRQAGAYTWAGLQAGLAAIAEGNTDNDVNAAIYHGLVTAGSEAPSITPILMTGERTGWLPHQPFRRYPLLQGDPVYMEVTGVHNRYGAPSMRTGVLGEPSDDVRRLADASIAAVEVLLETVAPGRTGDEIARIAEQTKEAIPEATSGGAFGYSIGLGTMPTWTEAPVYLAPGEQRPLEVGMTFHLPNGRWIPGGCGAGFSESIVVTSDGCECLTPNRDMFLKSF
jgi:Xaa-Pro dipeptidase